MIKVHNLGGLRDWDPKIIWGSKLCGPPKAETTYVLILVGILKNNSRGRKNRDQRRIECIKI